jgi:hypothetical protein
MPDFSTEPLWKHIRIRDDGIIFTPKESATYDDIRKKMDANYPLGEYGWHLFGSLGKEDCIIYVWKSLRDGIQVRGREFAYSHPTRPKN